MPVVPVRNLVGGQGVNKDKSPNSLAPNSFSEVINARFVRDRLERFGGTQTFADSATVTELADARAAFGFVRNGSEGIVAITDDEIRTTINGTTWVDRTPVGGIVDRTDWNLTQYGDWLLLTSLGNQPLCLDPAGTLFEIFANWPVTYECQKLIPYKNILIAIGVEINNNPQSGLVKWSDVVNVANVDTVDWDFSNPASLSGENVLPDRDGEIRDGGVLRDSCMLYADASVWRVDLSNTQVGVSPVVFNFRKVFSDDGIIANRCFVEVAGLHYVVGLYDIYRHDGFQKTTISDNRMTEFFYDRLGNNQIVFLEHYQRPQEIIINYSVGSDGLASEAMVYNYFYDTWTRWQFDDQQTGGLYSHFFQGPEFDTNIPTWGDLQTDGVLWSDLNNTTWNALFPQNRNRVPYMLAVQAGDEKIFQVDVGGNFTSETPIEMFIERRDLDLDEIFGHGRSIKYISKFLPLVTGEGNLRIQFGGRNALGEPIVWQPERTYDIASDYKLDLRVSWRYPALRLIQDSADGTFALDGFDLLVGARNKR